MILQALNIGLLGGLTLVDPIPRDAWNTASQILRYIQIQIQIQIQILLITHNIPTQIISIPYLHWMVSPCILDSTTATTPILIRAIFPDGEIFVFVSRHES